MNNDKELYIEVFKEVAEIDMRIWNKLMNENNEDVCPIDNRSIIWLQSDIETILTRSKNQKETLKIIKGIINDCVYSKEIKKLINYQKAIKGAYVRKHWKKVLEETNDICKVSHIIGWGLSNFDLCNLAKLYQKAEKKLKTKIEDLLTDCNFHTDCGNFINGNFDEYIKEA